MTIQLTILKGSRYTLWNVSTICITEIGADINFTDRPSTVIQGRIETIKIK